MAFHSPPPKPFLSPSSSSSSINTPTAYLTKRASFMKEKLVETANRTSLKLQKLGSSSSSSLASPSTTGSSKNLLSRREHAVLNEALKHIIVHLRARVFLTKTSPAAAAAAAASEDKDGPSPVVIELFSSTSSTTTTTLQDARIIASIGETSGLAAMLESLPKFTVQTLCNVVKLILLSSDAPLLPLRVCGEVVFLQHQLKPGQPKVVDVDDLRGALGKAPARNIDVLGQLMTLLHEDTTPNGASRLSYSFGPLLFLPRFDNSSKISKEYEGFDVLGSTAAVVATTKQMIEMVNDVFALEDREVIQAAAKKMNFGGTLLASAGRAAVGDQPPTNIAFRPPQLLNLRPGQEEARRAAPDGGDDLAGEKYETLYDFDAENPNEISLKQGEIVIVTEKGEDGWWSGTNARGETGLFPGNYVGELLVYEENIDDDDDDDDDNHQSRQQQQQQQPEEDQNYDDNDDDDRVEEESRMVESAAEKLAKLEAMLLQEREARKRAEQSLQTERRRSQEAVAAPSGGTNVVALAALLQAKTKLNKV